MFWGGEDGAVEPVEEMDSFALEGGGVVEEGDGEEWDYGCGAVGGGGYFAQGVGDGGGYDYDTSAVEIGKLGG